MYTSSRFGLLDFQTEVLIIRRKLILDDIMPKYIPFCAKKNNENNGNQNICFASRMNLSRFSLPMYLAECVVLTTSTAQI